jgi:hypothetical protein
MRAMQLENIDQLDELLARPIRVYAASHSEPPDEEYDLTDRMYSEADRQLEAQQRFNSLIETRYVN